jgi:hypothetical protein
MIDEISVFVVHWLRTENAPKMHIFGAFSVRKTDSISATSHSFSVTSPKYARESIRTTQKQPFQQQAHQFRIQLNANQNDTKGLRIL